MPRWPVFRFNLDENSVVANNVRKASCCCCCFHINDVIVLLFLLLYILFGLFFVLFCFHIYPWLVVVFVSVDVLGLTTAAPVGILHENTGV